MSRKLTSLTDDITMTSGHDHALGNFLQIQDKRFAGTFEDVQGEGYVFEWDELFGIGTNLLMLTKEEFKAFTVELIINKCNEFAKTIEDD